MIKPGHRSYLIGILAIGALGAALILVFFGASLLGSNPWTGLLLAVVIAVGSIGSAYLIGWGQATLRVHRSPASRMEERLRRREATFRRRVQELSILHEISLAASSGVGVDEVLNNAADAMRKTLPYSHLAIFLIDEERQEMAVAHGYGEGFEDALKLRLPVSKGITGEVVRSGEPILVGDVIADQRYVKVNPTTRSELCVPIKSLDRVIGGINVESPDIDAFDDADVSFLMTIAGQLALIIANARLLDDARRRATTLAALQSTSQAMIAQLDLRTLLNTMAQVASQVFDAPATAVYVFEPGSEDMYIVASSGLSSTFTRDQRLVGGRTLDLSRQNEGQPIRLDSIALRELAQRPEQVTADGLTNGLLIPLRHLDALIGAIVVYSRDNQRLFSGKQVELAQLFAGQAVVCLENARLFADARRATEMVALQRVAATLSSTLNINDVLQTVVAVTAEVMHTQKAAIFDLDETNGSLNLVVSTGLSDAFKDGCQRLPVREHERGVAGLGQPVPVADIETDSRFAAFVPLARSEGFRSFLDVPLRSKGKVVGVLTAYYATVHNFTAAEIELMSTLASQAAVAMDNARLYGQTDADLQRRVDELTTLQQISLRLVSSLDLNTVLHSIAESTLRLISADDVHIFLYDEERKAFTSGTALWASGEVGAPVMLPRPNGVTMTAVRERRPIVISDAEHHPLYSGPDTAPWGVKAIASFPLLRAQSVVGAFNVAFLQPHQFSEDELRVLKLLADQAAIAADNARLHERLADQAMRDSLTQVYNHGHLLQALDSAVDHAKRTMTPLSFIMLDIDNFKSFNDTYGHVTGDIVLRSIVQAIRSCIKRTDTVGRWGGEEFSVILPSANPEQARQVAARIREMVAGLDLVSPDGERLSNPTISQGIAALPDHASSADGLVERADRALYAGKGRGRDQIMVAENTQSP